MLTVAVVPLIVMSAAAGSVPAPGGGASAAEAQMDMIRLLTVLNWFLEIPDTDLPTHHVCLALRKAALVRWNGGFIHLAAEHIDQLVYDNALGHEVKLKMSCKLQLHALLVCCHEVSHKKGGDVDIARRTLDECKQCCNSEWP